MLRAATGSGLDHAINRRVRAGTFCSAQPGMVRTRDARVVGLDGGGVDAAYRRPAASRCTRL